MAMSFHKNIFSQQSINHLNHLRRLLAYRSRRTWSGVLAQPVTWLRKYTRIKLNVRLDVTGHYLPRFSHWRAIAYRIIGVTACGIVDSQKRFELLFFFHCALFFLLLVYY